MKITITGTVHFTLHVNLPDDPYPPCPSPIPSPGKPVVEPIGSEGPMTEFVIRVDQTPPKSDAVTTRELHVSIGGEEQPMMTVSCDKSSGDWTYSPPSPSFLAEAGDRVEVWAIDTDGGDNHSPESPRNSFTVDETPPPPPDTSIPAPDMPVVEKVPDNPPTQAGFNQPQKGAASGRPMGNRQSRR